MSVIVFDKPEMVLMDRETKKLFTITSFECVRNLSMTKSIEFEGVSILVDCDKLISIDYDYEDWSIASRILRSLYKEMVACMEGDYSFFVSSWILPDGIEEVIEIEEESDSESQEKRHWVWE